MFDVSFSELFVIALIGLIVIGPERMPRVARTVGHLLGRLQRYVSEVKADINREMQVEDLKKLQTQMTEQARDLQQQVNTQMKDVESSLNQSIQPPAPDPAVTETPPAQTASSDKPPPQTPPPA